MWEPESYVLDLSDVVRLSDDDLMKICAANPDLRIEQNAAGQLEIMPPAGASSSSRDIAVALALGNWNRETKAGVVFGSSAGFRLPNGAVRATDAAWVRHDRWSALTNDQQETFAPVVPDFLVEIRSPSDSISQLQAKMSEWMENGCRLAWLIDPFDHVAIVYRADGSTATQTFDHLLSGEEILPGFAFDPHSLP
jgi:Uma2 family endonuclease